MKILEVDLTNQRFSWKKVRDEIVSDYLGGRGLGVRYLYEALPPGVDPLSPENILSLWTSPLMSAGALSMVKLCGVTKSPLTNTILMSLMGGNFGPYLRFAGADGVIFKGRSETPVYLLLNEGVPELKPAQHLWGRTTRETEEIMREELDLKRLQIASIGPAGENGVLFASIMHGGDAMGRGGIGTVMGSKNLKAIAVSGRSKPEIRDKDRFQLILKKVIGNYKESDALKEFGEIGTTRHVNGLNPKGIYPVKNFQAGEFPNYHMVNADVLNNQYVQKRFACFSCSIRCRRNAEVTSGPYAHVLTEGPEYETIWSFGGNCENKNIESIIAANDLCLEYGMDTISAGGVVGFAMECFEKGLISLTDTDGIDLRFGNHQAIVALVHKIAHREGLGDTLSKGTKRAAEVIGKGASDFAMQVKGLELAAYEPRRAKGMGLGYATSPRGGCHERCYLLSEVFGIEQFSYEGKGALVQRTQDSVAIKDALCFCAFASAGASTQDLAEMFSAATGWEKTEQSLMDIGERICNLERLFNLREGFTRADDSLPKRFLKEPLPGPDGKPEVVDIDLLLDKYYRVRGWNPEGVPSEATLSRLELETEHLKKSIFEDQKHMKGKQD